MGVAGWLPPPARFLLLFLFDGLETCRAIVECHGGADIRDRDEAIRIKDQAVADQNSSLEDNEALRAEGVKQRQRHDEQLEDLRASSIEEIEA